MSIAKSSQTENQLIKNSQYPDNPLICVDLNVGSKKRAIEKIASLMSRRCQSCLNDILESLVQRERLGSTAIGQGLAIPHGRLAGLKQPIGALVLLKDPIEFDAPDKLPVKILIGIVVPENDTDEHLSLLRSIADIAQDPTAMHILNTNRQPEVLYQWLNNRNPKLAKIML